MNRNILIEFASSLSEDDLKFLYTRLNERLSGDVAEALDFMSHYKALDSQLSVAKSAFEVYNICDSVTEVLHKECRKRNLQFDR